jgi:hypothetical protein
MEGFRSEVLGQGASCAAAQKPSSEWQEAEIVWVSSDSDDEFRV